MTGTEPHGAVLETDAARQFMEELNARLLRLAAESPDVDYDPRRRGGGATGRCETDTFRGYTYCKHTIVKLKVLAAATLQYYLKMLQGSYSTSTAASKGTHGGGGAGDTVHGNWTEAIDNWVMNLARDVAFLIYWDRDAIPNVWSDHGHFIDPSCPNLSPEAAAQVVDFYNNRNGLANDGPDFGSRKSVTKLWNMYLNRSTTTVASIEALFAPPEEEYVPLTDDDVKKIWAYKNAELTTRDAYDLLRRAGIQVWDEVKVTRDGEQITVKQELANMLTTLREFNTKDVTRDTALQDRVEALHDALGAKISLVLEAIAADVTPDPPEPEPDPAFTFGFDMSGNQTVEAFKAALADPQYAFAGLKISEGITFRNSRLDEQAALFKDWPGMRLFYHYNWQKNDGVAEARWFWQNVEPFVRPGDILAKDFENWGKRDANGVYVDMVGVTWQQRFDHYWDFREELQRLSGSIGIIYPTWDVIKAFRSLCGMRNEDGSIKTTPTPEWTEFTKDGLWLPQYYITIDGVRRAVKPGEYDTVSGGWPLFMHQYTSNPFDKNWMPGGRQHWAKHALK